MDVTCPLCGVLLTHHKEWEGDYEIRTCEACGAEFAYPMKGGTGEFYEKSYGATGGGYGENKWEFSRFLGDAKKLGLRGKLLEVGCGPGWFLKMAQGAGFEVYGIDFNREAVEHAKNLGLTNIKQGDLEALKDAFPETLFDVIVLFHVFEHLEDPNRSLQEFKKLLTPGGVLVLATPNRRRTMLSINLRSRREGWDYPPHHLTRWDKESLLKILTRNGFLITILEEERVYTPKQVMQFITGALQLLTSTSLMANAVRQESDGGSSPTLSLLKLGAQIKGALTFAAGAVLFAPVFVVARLFPPKGVNLYAISRDNA